MAKATRKLRTALEEEAGGSWRKALKRRREAQKAVLEVSRAIARWMEPHWTALHDESSQYRTLIQQGRLCLLSQVAAFLQYILVQLQSLAGLVTAGLLLLLMAETSYPFQPHEPLLLFGWVIILIVVAVTILIFVQLSRDKVISLLSGTTPHSPQTNSPSLIFGRCSESRVARRVRQCSPTVILSPYGLHLARG